MAPAAAVATRATLESLLRDRKLDNTLTSARPWSDQGLAPDRLAPTGLLPLDAALGGGFPRGQVSEIVGPASSGRTSIVCSLMASATRQGELAALVDVLDRFDPPSAAEAGVVLDQVLWVRGHDVQAEQPALSPDWEPARPRTGLTVPTPAGQALDRAVKALGLVLSAGGFGLVVFDAADVPVRALGQLPFTTWLRLQRMIEGTDTACVLLSPRPLGRSAGGASIRLDGLPAVLPAPRAPQPASFHDRVRASRRPFLGPGPAAGPARSPGRVSSAGAVWSDASPRPRRLRGLALQADVQCGLRSTSCALTVAR